jgi:phospholysine phosphohistidine inorganic pyrophosphate phosphatase
MLMHDNDSELDATTMPGPATAYLLDLDGTLYTGDAAIPGAPGALARLRAGGTPFRLVTNTTSRSRRMLVERLAGYGLDARAEEIVTATLAGAELSRARGYGRVAPFVPSAALEDLRGLELRGGTSDQAHGAVDAVIVGDLGDRWTFALLQEAFEQLMAGAALVALSRDRYFRQGERLALDAGPFVAALEYAAGSAAMVAGKPSAAFFHGAVRTLGLPADRSIAMVGDDLWSDVEGAQRAGLQGWLVRTGKFREDALRDAGITPDRVLASVAELS